MNQIFELSQKGELLTLGAYRRMLNAQAQQSNDGPQTDPLGKFLAEYLDMIAETFGTEFTDHQVQIGAQLLKDNFPMLTVADLALFYRHLITGAYGPILKLDLARITTYLQTYLDERCQAGAEQSQQAHEMYKNEPGITFSRWAQIAKSKNIK